jgi:hypothetical protein
MRSSLLHRFTQEHSKEIYFVFFSEVYTTLHEFWNLKQISKILNRNDFGNRISSEQWWADFWSEALRRGTAHGQKRPARHVPDDTVVHA